MRGRLSVEFTGISFTECRFHVFLGFKPGEYTFQNIERDGRAFVVIFDSHAAEGTGEGLYMKGGAKKVNDINGAVTLYQFTPEQIWINDEAKNEDGTYAHDIRIELDIEELKKLL